MIYVFCSKRVILLQNGSTIEISNNIIITEQEYIIKFEILREMHMGKYTCVAKNAVGLYSNIFIFKFMLLLLLLFLFK